jgi:hypothetical protein
MSFSQDNGYLPVSVGTIIDSIRQRINTVFGQSYTAETFVGTGWYKYAYAIAQRIQENEVKASETFQKLQEYVSLTNEKIKRPSVTNVGLLNAFSDADYIASVKPIVEEDAGLVSICVQIDEDITGKQAQGLVEITSYVNLVSGADDSIKVGSTTFTAQTGAATPGDATFRAATSNQATALSLAAQINAHATASTEVVARAFGAKVIIKAIDLGVAGNTLDLVYTDNDSNVGLTVSGTDLAGGTAADDSYDDIRLEVASLVKDFVAAGIPSLGTETESIVLPNGQNFDFSFFLPDRIAILLRLTLDISENTLTAVPTDVEIRQLVFDQINERYQLGYNFEPQRYFDLGDAPWAADLLLEWSMDDGDTWSDNVFDADFDELLTFGLEDIDVVINT